MKVTYRHRLLSLLLAFVIMFELLPTGAFAYSTGETANTELPDESTPVEDDSSDEGSKLNTIRGEVEELREEDSKQFLMDDGSYLAVSYGMPVHYQDDEGEWIDIDNTLTPASAYSGSPTYSIANGEAATAFAGNLTEGLLFSTEYKGNQVSLSLLDAAEVVQLLREAGQDDLVQEDTGLVSEQTEATGTVETDSASTEAASTEPNTQETELTENVNNTEDTVSVENNDNSVAEDQAGMGTETVESHINEQNDPISMESTVGIPSVEAETSSTQVSEEETPSTQITEEETSHTQESEEETLGSTESEGNSSTPQPSEGTSSTEPAATEPLVTVDPSLEELVYDRTTIAQIIEPEELPFTLTEDQAPLADQIIPEKLSSAILYSDVYPGVDLEYNITGYNIKESIIVKEPLDSYRFSFRLDLDGLTPALQEDGSISLAGEDGTAVYQIPAPYMFDAAYHASNAASYTVTALEDGYLLTVEADAEWLNAADRAFPVTIDPTLLISAGSASGDIYATYVEQGAPTTVHGSQQHLYIGYTTYAGAKERLIYMYFNKLPTIPTGSVVVNASLNLWLTGYTEINCSEMRIGAYEVTASKPSTASSYYNWIYYMTWNTKATYDTANMIDYTAASTAKKGGYISWDLTELVNKWYMAGTENRTIALAGTESGSYSSTYCAEPVFYAYGQTKPPVLTVSYRNNVGLEPYFTYQTMDAGNAGTVYISDYSSQLTVTKDILSYASSQNPVALQLVFNSAYFSQQNTTQYDLCADIGMSMHIGSGCTYNLLRHIKKETIGSITYLRYLDGDGTLHYFAKDSSKDANYYYDEDGLGLKIKETSTNNYTMSDDKGNEWIFVGGLLYQVKDANGNLIQIYYSRSGTATSDGKPTGTGDRIEKITQKNSGQSEIIVATFTYKNHTPWKTEVTNYVSTIKDYAGNIYTFDYLNGKLSSIKFNSTEIAKYNMNWSTGGSVYINQLDSIVDVESGYTIAFTYSNHRVSAVQESSGSTTGAKFSITQTDTRGTTYRDFGADRVSGTSDDVLTCYSFDYAGRTVNAYTTNNSGKILGATNAAYSENSGTNKQNNRTIRTATIGVAGQQEMRNSGFESSDSAVAWTLSGGGTTETGTTTAITTTKPHSGQRSFQGWIASGTTATIGAYKSSNQLQASTTYTLSAYVNTTGITSFSSSGIYLQVSDTSGNVWKSDPITYATSSSIENGWTRLTLTFTTKVQAIHTIAVYNNSCAGTFYVDDFQLEAGSSPSARNMIENGSLQYWGYGWNMNPGASYVTNNGLNATDAYAYSIQIVGSPTEQNGNAWQDIPVYLPSSQTYVLSGWAKANSVPDNVQTASSPDWDQNKQYGLRALLYYTDGAFEYHYVPFNPDLPGWQFTSMTIVPRQANKTVSIIKVLCAYERNANKAYFDNISLVQEAAQTMKYDDDGNLTSVTSTGLSADTNEYDGGNLMQTVTGGNGTYTYSYDTKHNLTSVTNGFITQNLTYSTMGNVTGTTLTGSNSSSLKLQSSASYTSSGNLLSQVTDSSGSTVTYAYGNSTSIMTGQPTSTTNTMGTVVASTYDSRGRITKNEIASTVSLAYNYSKGLLSSVSRTNGSTTQQYNFTYDAFGNRTKIQVGTTTLAQYTYAANNGNLTKQTYANGGTVSYTYDNLNRVKTAVYSDGRTLTYTYTGDGQLYSVLDNNGTTSTTDDRTYLYNYDALGRLISSSEKRGSTVALRTSQQYNEYNQLKSQAWQMGTTSYSESYTYNSADGSLATMQAPTGQTLTFTYDALRRLNSVATGIYTRTYTYRDIYSTQGFTQTSTQVSKIAYSGITSVTSAAGISFEYTYDTLGNIASETSRGVTTTYSYDSQGQLTQAAGANTYTYTYDGAGNILTASDGTTSHTYTYGNGQWKDLLTAFDGESITYSGGNPTSYYNGTRWSLGWKEGRNLTSASATGKSLTFAYDLDGTRIIKTTDGVTHNYIYASGKLLRETYSGKTLDFFYDSAGYPYALKYNGTKYYYITNLQGDVIRLVNSNGESVAIYTYDPYGKVLSASGTMANINPLRYRGYYYDTETGFYYLQSRYYDPAIGRFINADSYVSSGDTFISYNMFAYCGNNPVMGYDPTGEWDWGTFLNGAGLITTGVVALTAALTVITCGTAAPLMVAVAAVTASAGTLTIANGAAEVAESVTGYNVIRDGAFGGNSDAYNTYRNGTKAVAEVGAFICGAYNAANGGNICFVAGTLVAMADGSVPIEEIQPGDYVWAWDEETGDVALKRVVETYINETDELVHVFVHGEEIVATPSHPFYSPVKGWTDAAHLRAGDILVLVNGEYVVVEKVQHELLESPVQVYNFQVEDYHTYYVSSSGVLVHNSCNHNSEWARERRNHWRNQSGMVALESDQGAYVATSSNLDRMSRGLAPKGKDGFSVVLHHVTGIVKDFYNYIEMTQTDHIIWHKINGWFR